MDFSPFSFPPLHRAVSDGDLDRVTDLLNQGDDVNALDQLKRTPLLIAASGEEKKLAKMLDRLSDLVGQRITGKMDLSKPVDIKSSLDQMSQFDPAKLMGLQYERRKHDCEDSDAEPEDTAIAELLLKRGAAVDDASQGGSRPLHAAASSGKIATMRLLIEHGADVNAMSPDETALFAACQAGHYAAVRLLIASGADCELRSKSGGAALHAAARGGSTEIVRTLLSLGTDVNVQTERGMTPLATAAMFGQPDVVQLLREKGARIDFLEALALEDFDLARTLAVPPQATRHPNWAFPILRWAVKTGKREVIRILVRQGVHADPEDDEGRKLIRLAVLRGETEMLKFLLPSGASVTALDLAPETPASGDPERTNSSGRTTLPALSLAVSHNNIEMARMLISRGADVNARDEFLGPLASGVMKGQLEMVNLLLDAGANVNGIVGDHMCPLGCAVLRDDPEMVRLLLARGADPTNGFTMAMAHNKPEIQKLLKEHVGTDLLDLAEAGETSILRSRLEKGQLADTRNQHGTTPLMVAARAGQIETVRELIEAGADVNAITNYGATPLLFAIPRSHVDIVRILIEHGAFVAVSDDTAINPMLAACRTGHLEMINLIVDAGGRIGLVESAALGDVDAVRSFLNSGCDVDLPPPSGDTALMEAARSNSLEIIELLLERGAAINCVDKRGETPLGHAVAAQKYEAVRLLLEKGADVNAVGVNQRATERLQKLTAENRSQPANLHLPEWITRVDAVVYGASPLHSAALLGDVKLAALLLDSGADIESLKGHSGGTPLIGAAMLGKPDMVRFLLDRGANPHAAEMHGYTALEWAKLGGKHPETIALLEEAMSRQMPGTGE